MNGKPRGLAHFPSAEAIARYRDVPVDAKLRWLDEALRFTEETLPQERRRAWQLMRGRRDVLASGVTLDDLHAGWPPFVAALRAGEPALRTWARQHRERGLPAHVVADLALEYVEWLRVTTDWSRANEDLLRALAAELDAPPAT
jgi:hypothetical protein